MMNDAFLRGFLDEMEKCSGFFKDQGEKLLKTVKKHGPAVIRTTGNLLERTGAGAVGAVRGAVEGAAKGAYKGATTGKP
jgi:hypothetical protein